MKEISSIHEAREKTNANNAKWGDGSLVQEPGMENGVDVVTHQKWSGANYVDNMLKMVTGGVSSTGSDFGGHRGP